MLHIPKRSAVREGSDSISKFIPVISMAILFVVYVSFLSKHYIGDGLRTYRAAIDSPTPPIGPAHHLLAPTLAWLYFRLGKGIGYAGDDISLIQSMNALFGAVGVGLFFPFLMAITGSLGASVLGVLLLAFSRAYSMHATDMTEVMPSFALSMAAFVFALKVGKARGFLWAILAGLGVALATSVYQTSLLDVPAITVVMLFGRQEVAEAKERNYGPAIVFLSSFGVFVGAIYLTAFRLTQAATLTEALGLATQIHPRMSVAGSFNPIHVFGSAFGWANAVFGLRDWLGGTRLLERGLNWIVVYNVSILLFLIATTLFLARAYVAITPDVRRGRRYVFYGLLLWFVLPALFTAYWIATHEKLWVHPTAAYVSLVCFLFGSVVGWRSLSASIRWRATACVGGLVVLTIGINVLFQLIPNRFHVNRELEEARQISKIVRDEDLVIGEGNDPVSVYFQTFARKPYLSYFSLAYYELGMDRDRMAKFLREKISEVRRRNGHIYFLALLDISQKDWRRFLSNRFPLEYYHDLDIYRSNKTLVMPIRSYSQDGVVRGLWRLDSPPE